MRPHSTQRKGGEELDISGIVGFEWLPALNARRKWLTVERDIQVNDVVLVISSKTPRGHWPLGRVIEVYPGQDGHVRVPKVHVGNEELLSRITKLCQLELS